MVMFLVKEGRDWSRIMEKDICQRCSGTYTSFLQYAIYTCFYMSSG